MARGTRGTLRGRAPRGSSPASPSCTCTAGPQLTPEGSLNDVLSARWTCWRVEETPLARFLLDGRGASWRASVTSRSSVKYTDTDGRLFYTPATFDPTCVTLPQHPSHATAMLSC